MRTSLKMIVAVIGLLGAGVSTADAADNVLYTSSQFRAGRIFDCNVINVGDSNVTVRTQFIDAFLGTVDTETGDVVLEPGRGNPIGISGSVGGATEYCKFIVTSGKKESLRGSYCVNDADGVCTAAGDAR